MNSTMYDIQSHLYGGTVNNALASKDIDISDISLSLQVASLHLLKKSVLSLIKGTSVTNNLSEELFQIYRNTSQLIPIHQ